jgi:predicted nucleic acid-binding Zn ribbon protein
LRLRCRERKSQPMNRPPRRPRMPEPQTFADLLPQMVARMGGAARSVEQRVFMAYDRAAGVQLATHSRPERLKDGTLIIRLESSALAQELAMLKRTLIERITQELGEALVTDIRTRVGPLED